MEGSFTLTLGGEAIAVPPLTMGQLRRICVALPKATGTGGTPESFDAEVEIIAAALSLARPEITPEILLQRAATRKEMGAAINTILVAGAYIEPKKDDAPGEAAAGSP